jgi:hypothetical protein
MILGDIPTSNKGIKSNKLIREGKKNKIYIF